jgi:ubiquinone/menaquinone biosynthesis C-methylase UbiE/cytosine/adenosine deaminase-related metal-dependent hydrolase
MNFLTAREEVEQINAASFDAWAEVYDGHDNPLLVLEERFLRHMLPELTDKSVLDIGCGTGRWLECFAHSGAKSVVGLDASQPMLNVAKKRRLPNTHLLHARLPEIPLDSASTDLVLGSFVLSYVADIDRCACEISRVLRNGGDFLVTDMHPGTAAQLGWERRFRAAGNDHVLTTQQWTIEKTIEVMLAAGFTLQAAYEPCFDIPEQEIFRRHEMHEAWKASMGKPAIYLLHFRKPIEQSIEKEDHNLFIEGAECVIGNGERVRATLAINQKEIAQVTSSVGHQRQASNMQIDLDGYVLFPGLVNAHDHLEFALFPKLGVPVYRNATEWAHDIQARYAPTITQHKRVPKEIRLWWGALRNLLCGVTTVCHHNPIDPVMCDPAFPVKVVKAFDWEHSPAFTADLSVSLKKRTETNPFVIHACEGIDPEAANDLQVLVQAGAIDPRTILVHGLALSMENIAYLNRQGASLVACMSSNQFLFEQTLSSAHLQAVDRLALGSDSPLTAVGDLLDEIRFCREVSRLPTSSLYEAVTRQPASMLRLADGEGRIAVGSSADVFAVRANGASPSELLSSLYWYDVELVIVDGTVRLASPEILSLLPRSVAQTLNPLCIDGIVRWLAAPTAQMFEVSASVLGRNNVSLSGRKISLMEA